MTRRHPDDALDSNPNEVAPRPCPGQQSQIFVSRSLVGVQPSVTSKEGDEEEELYRTSIRGYKVKREHSDDEPHEQVQQCRTRSHDESSKRLTE